MVTNDISNPFKTILDRLDAQDATLAAIRTDHEALRQRWDENVSEQRQIRVRMDGMDAERARLLTEAQLYKDATDTRLRAVEARDTIQELQAAVRLQLLFHRWWTGHKISIRVGVVAAAIGSVLANNVVRAIFQHFGWL